MRRFKVWNEVLKRWVDGQVCFLRADGDGFFMQDGKLCGMAPHYKVVFSTGLHDKDGKEVTIKFPLDLFRQFQGAMARTASYLALKMWKVSG